MKHLPGFISSLDPPMVTAEVKKPVKTDFTDFYCILDKKSFKKAMQEYHKAIEPMKVDNAKRWMTSNKAMPEWCLGSKKYKYGNVLKLHQKVEFIKTETGCRITKIVNQ